MQNSVKKVCKDEQKKFTVQDYIIGMYAWFLTHLPHIALAISLVGVVVSAIMWAQTEKEIFNFAIAVGLIVATIAGCRIVDRT